MGQPPVQERQQQPPVRLLYVEDDRVVREAIGAALEQAGEVAVMGDTGNGAGAVDLARRLGVDVVLLDLQLPDVCGLDVARRLRAELPEIAVIVLTGHDNPFDRAAVLEIGVAGYLTKDVSVEDLLATIRAVASGQHVLMTLSAFGGRQRAVALTDREREILTLLATGARNAEIATQLGLAEKTVEAHVTHLLEKLGAQSRVEAVLEGYRHGIVRLDQAPGRQPPR